MNISQFGRGSSKFDGLVERLNGIQEFHYNTPVQAVYNTSSNASVTGNIALMDGMALDFLTEFAGANYAIGKTTYTLGLLGDYVVNHIFIRMPNGSQGFTGPEDDAEISIHTGALKVEVWDDGTIEVYDNSILLIKNRNRLGSATKIAGLFVENPVVYLYREITGYDNSREMYMNRLDFSEATDNRFSLGYAYRAISITDSVLYLSTDNYSVANYHTITDMGYTRVVMDIAPFSWYFSSKSPLIPAAFANQLTHYGFSNSSGGQIFYLSPNDQTELIDHIAEEVNIIEGKVESLSSAITGIASLNYPVR